MISFGDDDIPPKQPKEPCNECLKRSKRKYVLQMGREEIYLASQDELVMYLKSVIEGKTPRTLGEKLGGKVRIDKLTKEQAALMLYEITEYGFVKTKPPLLVGTIPDVNEEAY
jgi:hypothetical protein